MTEFEFEILDGERAGTVVPLSAKLTVGRRPDNDLVLQDEKTSGKHAEVVREGDSYVVRDLGSTNGTLIDGRRIEEVALTPADVVQFGRIRVRFRQVGAAPAPAVDDDPIQLHRLDGARLQATGGKGALVALAALLAIGGAAVWWFFLRVDAPRRRAATASAGAAEPLRVPGNKLDAATAACEAGDDGGWDLRAGGGGFSEGGEPHTGSGALEALRVDADGAAGSPFALARTKAAVPISSGAALVVRAWLRTADGGRGALRVRFGSDPEREGEPTLLWTGTEPAEFEDYTEVELQCVAPVGVDQVEVELLALLPADGASVSVDDVALTRGEGGQAVRLEQSGRVLTGVGSNFTMRSTEGTVVTRVGAVAVSGPNAAVAAAGLDCPSDSGLTVAASAVDGRGYRLVGSQAGLALHFAPAIRGRRSPRPRRRHVPQRDVALSRNRGRAAARGRRGPGRRAAHGGCGCPLRPCRGRPGGGGAGGRGDPRRGVRCAGRGGGPRARRSAFGAGGRARGRRDRRGRPGLGPDAARFRDRARSTVCCGPRCSISSSVR